MIKSLTVREYMSANLVTFTPDMEFLRAVHALVENRISGATVVDEHGNVIGILSEQDCMRVALNGRYPVVDDNRLIGQISRRDLLRAMETLR